LKAYNNSSINSELKQFFSILDDEMIVTKTDLSGIITYASKSFQNISGYSKEELLGSSQSIVKDPNTSDEFFKNIWNTLSLNQTFKGEVRNQNKDGSFYWLKVIITSLYENDIKVGYRAIYEQLSAKKELEEFSYIDELTSLENFKALNIDLNQNDSMFSTLILVNIDNFQNINGLYGFEAGNIILKEFSLCLKDFNTEKTYKLYRIYADTFVLFNNNDFSSIDSYYDDLVRLKKIINNYDFYIKGIDDTVNIDITMGVSLGQENPMVTADMALRYAKKYKIWFKAYLSNINLKDKLKNTLYWKDKIKHALLDDRIVPVFQSIVDRKKEIVKYEVLLRMKDENGELILPYKFLDESINIKQYNNIAKVIFQKTFDLMQTSTKNFSINISYEDIYNNDLINFIEKNIMKTPNIGKHLVIEILETSAIEDDSIMKEFIQKFRQYGVKIAIDDFGTGHSNLSYILNIHPDYIKIDGKFIKNINEDKQSFAMVKSIVAFCQELDIKIIAEFVHSAEVFETLYKLGIDEFQGYYFCEPKETL